MNKTTFLFLVSFLCFSSLQGAVYEYDEKEMLKSASELDYPPFSIVTEENKADGFSVELLKNVAKAMGRNVEFYVAPWNDIKNDLKNGNIDVLPVVGRTPEREKYYDFSIPYLEMHGSVIVRKNDNSIKSKNNLKNKKLLVMKGDNAEEYIVRNKITNSILETPSYEKALTALSQGEGDAVVVQKLVGLQLIKKLDLTNLKSVDFLLNDFKQDFSFAVKEGDKELLALLNEGLAIVKANGTYVKIYKKWFSSIENNDAIHDQIIYSLIGFILLLSIVVVVSLIWHKTLNNRINLKTKELRENQELYENFFENSKSANVIYATDDYGETFTIVHVNKTFENIENLKRENVIGKKVNDLFKGAEVTGVFDIFKAVYRTGEAHHIPTTLFSFRGQHVWRENYIFKLSTGDIVASYIDHTNEKKLEDDRIENHEQTLVSLVELIEHRDTYTGGHSMRVATYSKMVAEEMGYSQSDCELIYRAGILHDIGKIITPDTILLKPGILNNNEYKLIQSHVTSGADMLEKIPMYKHMSEIVRAHHERLDGSGYPNNLKAEEIPPLARIMAVCDSFDAMTTNRIYKGRKSVEAAIAELKILSGKDYDPDVVGAAERALVKIKLDDSISQLPTSVIEQQRFAFFFRDQVTNTYNQSYLDVVLKKNHYGYEYKCLDAMLLHNFSKYNEKYGWDNGDKLLNRIASTMEKEFPDGMVFRLHGDDFIVINKEHCDVNIQKIEKMCELEDKDLSLELIHFHIQKDEINNIAKLEQALRKRKKEAL